MTLWNHAETPFGNIVYTVSTPTTELVGKMREEHRGPEYIEVNAHGVAGLDAAAALATDYQGDTVPNWDAMKAEAKRIAEAKGAPFPAWWAPNPELVVNGKGYHNSLTVTYYDAAQPEHYGYYAGNVLVRLDGITDAARRKVADWFAEARSVILSPDVLAAHTVDRAITRARRATEKKIDANKAAAAAREESFAADTALARLGVVLDLNGKVV